MRIPFVAGNWKMNKTVKEAQVLVDEMVPALKSIMGVEKVLCPPFTSLLSLSTLLKGTDIGLGAQNMHWESKGAYTGDISPAMVAEFCNYVIIGHSERRAYFGETDEKVHKKIVAAQDAGLVSIVCVGETLEQYEAGQTSNIVGMQVKDGLKGFAPGFAEKIVVAYEPVWAIGTGKASTGVNANAVLREVIRPALASIFGEEISKTIRVLYGGSVTSTNAEEFFSQDEIDGALVGGASLKSQEFIAIVQAAAK